MKVKFHPNKITTTTIRWEEEGDPDAHKVSTIYVKKSTLKELGVDTSKSLEDLAGTTLEVELSVST